MKLMQLLVTQQMLPLSQTNANVISDGAAARATAITNEADAATADVQRYRYRNKCYRYLR
jgi:hypothetical protein